MAQYYCDLTCTPTILGEPGPNITLSHTHSNNFSWNWPKIIVIFRKVVKTLPPLGQFFAQMAQILCASNNFFKSCFFTPTCFGENGPNFTHYQRFFSYALQQFSTPLRHSDACPAIYRTAEKTLPPLRIFWDIMAKVFQWCHAQSTKRPMGPENSRPH